MKFAKLSKGIVFAVGMAVLAPQAPAFAKDDDSGKDEKSDPVICRKVEVIGSRLRAERVCMTREQWAQKKRDDRAALDQVQSGRYKSE